MGTCSRTPWSPGPISYRAHFPILLTRPDSVDAFTAGALGALAIDRVVVAGGVDAVRERTAGQLADVRGDDSIAVRRLAGDTRQGTAVAMAGFATSELGFSRLHATLARGDMMVDAVAGGPHAGAEAAVILLTGNAGSLSNPTRSYLAAEATTLESVHVFGGPQAVSDAVAADVTETANSNDATKDPAKQ